MATAWELVYIACFGIFLATVFMSREVGHRYTSKIHNFCGRSNRSYAYIGMKRSTSCFRNGFRSPRCGLVRFSADLTNNQSAHHHRFLEIMNTELFPAETLCVSDQSWGSSPNLSPPTSAERRNVGMTGTLFQVTLSTSHKPDKGNRGRLRVNRRELLILHIHNA